MLTKINMCISPFQDKKKVRVKAETARSDIYDARKEEWLSQAVPLPQSPKQVSKSGHGKLKVC